MLEPKPQHIVRLENALQEINGQLVDEERAKVAKKANVDLRTLNPYLKGEVKSINTAKHIISVARKFIKDRDREIEKLTAA